MEKIKAKLNSHIILQDSKDPQVLMNNIHLLAQNQGVLRDSLLELLNRIEKFTDVVTDLAVDLKQMQIKKVKK